MRSYLGLSTGDVFPGESICSIDETIGEVVLYRSKNFRYQILTDPVNFGKIVVSDSDTVDNRWPLFSEIESFSPHLKALVILGSLCDSDYQNKNYNLKNYLNSNQITFFQPLQPDLLKIVLNKFGSARGIITSNLKMANNIANGNTDGAYGYIENHNHDNNNCDPIRTLSTSLEFFWDMPGQRRHNGAFIDKKYVVVAYDFGLPYSALRNLTRFDCDIRIVPADYPPEELIALKPEGILLAGGPGNPEKMRYAMNNIARLIGLRPILASGLGHILLALSMGAKTELLNRPHFGYEIEVENASNHSSIEKMKFKTDQTHSISLKQTSLEKAGFRVTLVNTIDNTVEGYENEEFLIQSYAFSLGGNDDFTASCIKRFVDCMEIHRAGKKLI